MNPNTVNFAQSERRSDLDWLRVLAVLLLVPFHAALIFVLNPHSIMYIKDTVNSVILDRWAGWVHRFHMPLLFCISGAASFFALQRRSGRQYLQERLMRLLGPALFGIVVLVPPMTYITRIARGDSLNFWQHYRGFWRLNIEDLAGLGGTLTPAHLWFLIFLFVFSLVALPGFLLLRRQGSQQILSGVAAIFTRPGLLFLFTIPLALLASVDFLDDKNPLYYGAVFCLGYLLMTDARYQRAMDRDAPLALMLGIVCEILRQTWHPHPPEWSPLWMAYGLIVEQLNRWAWVLAFLGFGHRWLKRSGKGLTYLSQAAFPFYLFHLLCTTLVGYAVIQLPLGVPEKYGLTVLLAAAATFLGYELVRRIPGVRVLCGMKSQK